MLSIQFILNIFKESKAVQIIFLLLATTILQVVDLFFTIYLANIFGEYLIMAVICSISLIGLTFSILRIKAQIKNINEKCINGIFPESLFFGVTGIFFAAILIFIPGFISALIGFFLLIPLFSEYSGKVLSEKISTDWHTVYEYMKI